MRVFGQKRALEQELEVLEADAQTTSEKLSHSDSVDASLMKHAIWLALRICLLLIRKAKSNA